MTMPAADKIAAGSRIISSDFDQINRMEAIKNKKAEAVVCCFGLWCLSWRRPTFPHSCPCSIIGPARLNFRVRDGNGCDPRGMTTGNSKLANGFPSSSRAGSRVRQQNLCAVVNDRQLAGITSPTASRTTLCRKGVCAFLHFLKDGLRKFYD